MTANEFVAKVEAHCKALGVTTYFEREKPYVHYGDGLKCNGYFQQPPNPVLAVAMGRPEEEWFPTLVHEYCHMLQWANQDAEWVNNYYSSTEAIELFGLSPGIQNTFGVVLEACEILDFWMQGKCELTELQKMDVIKRCIEVEWGCERRVLELIEELNLPLNSERYAQTANSYVLFYHAVSSTRKWYQIGKEPYNTPHLVEMMPKKLVERPMLIEPRWLAAMEKLV